MVFLNEFILQEFFVYVSKHQNCSNSGSPVIEKIEKVIYRNTSVANTGCLSRILILLSISRIPDPTRATKRRGEQISCLIFNLEPQILQNFILFLNEQKSLSRLAKNYSTFTPKIVSERANHLLGSKIRDAEKTSWIYRVRGVLSPDF